MKTRLQAVLPGNRCLRRPAAPLCEGKLSDTPQEIYLTQLFVCEKKYLIGHIFTSFAQEDSWWIPFRSQQASPLRPCTQARWWPWNQVPSLRTLDQSSHFGRKIVTWRTEMTLFQLRRSSLGIGRASSLAAVHSLLLSAQEHNTPQVHNSKYIARNTSHVYCTT